MRSSVKRVSTASLSPLTTFITPSGSPASLSSSAINRVELGSLSEGFKIKQLPHTIAIGYIHKGTIAGKLNGVIPATTPSGWNSLQESILGATFLLCSPLSNSGAPQAYSTFSIPRCNSPPASWEIFPCSSPISAQIFSAFCSNKSLNLNMTLARLIAGVLRHAGYASCAAEIACSTVVLEASATCLLTSPVDGLYTSCVRSLSASI